jgi:hypothetical protein
LFVNSDLLGKVKKQHMILSSKEYEDKKFLLHFKDCFVQEPKLNFLTDLTDSY